MVWILNMLADSGSFGLQISGFFCHAAEAKAKGPRKSFFPNRIVQQWNEIADTAKKLSLSGFKNFLRDKLYQNF